MYRSRERHTASPWSHWRGVTLLSGAPGFKLGGRSSSLNWE